MVDGITRLATLEDEKDFLVLYREHWEEELRFDNVLEYTQQGMETVRQLARDYILGTMDGVVMLWEPSPGEGAQAYTLVGEPVVPAPQDAQWHRCCYMYGIYVRPAYRGSKASVNLGLEASKALKNLGFTKCRGAVTVGNGASYELLTRVGAVPYSVSMVYDL